jgi:CRISPR-associated endonuclease/helicase Cas3
MRGLEREHLINEAVFKRFLRGAEGAGRTAYLVCTSAGEVGVNISADDLICDLSTFESMAQRFGRVNRFGEPPDHVARVDVVYPAGFDERDELHVRRKMTLDLLKALKGDGSPAALGELDALSRAEAFAPPPKILTTSDCLLDAWAMTTIRDKMPGRPPVADYLHGLSDWEAPETYVAWREEVGVVTGDLVNLYPPDDLLDDYPLKPHELLRDRSDRIFEKLQALAARHPEEPVWVFNEQGQVVRSPRTGNPWVLGELAEPSATKAAARKTLIARIEGQTVLLPPRVGGLHQGMLDSNSEVANDVSYVDSPATERRLRIWSNDEDYDFQTMGMRLIRSIDPFPDSDGDEERPTWDWYKCKPLEDARTAQRPVLWDIHVSDVVQHAEQILARLSLSAELARAVRLAAQLHDHGKRRPQFQFTLGNRRFPNLVLAKSGRRGAKLPDAYRHEFGSVLDAQGDAEFHQLSPEMQDLVLHLIVAHHGRGRPHFSLEEVYDPANRSQADAERLACLVPQRFARLQRKYGRWGLAYLESLLRAADWAASAEPSEFIAEAEEALL